LKPTPGSLVLLAALAVERSARASPQEVIGFGYRSIAMGTTGAAAAEGVDAVYANPALLSLARRPALELGVMGATFALAAEGPGHPGALAYAPLGASTIGALLPLPFGGALADRVAVGLGFVTPFDVVVRARILYPETPQMTFADRVQSVAVQAAAGADLGYGLRLGGGFMALAALDGSVVVATDASGRVGTSVEDTLVASYAPLAGASLDLGESWRVGLAFRGELVGRFDVVIRASSLGDLTVPPLHVSGTPQYDPWALALEGTWATDGWRLALGVTYAHWLAYPGPAEATVRCEDAPDPSASCTALAAPAPDFSPTVSPRAGVERVLGLGRSGGRLLLRGGYAFVPSPAPEQVGATSLYDNHRSILGAGWGVRLGELAPLDFDGFLQVQLLHPRTHEKRVASGAPFDGEIRTSGLAAGGGVSATVRF
jgi:long-chain fatty acid transport protein